MMKKKKILSVAIVSIVLLFGAGVYTVLAGNSSGYDAYKEALKETHKMNSGITNMDVTISSNGKLLQEVTMQTAHDLKERRGSANIDVKTPDQTVELEINATDKNIYIENKAVDTTYVIENDRDTAEIEKKHGSFHNKELMNVAELVIDTLTRPLHDSFVKGSENTISIDITNEDLPSVIHAMGSYMVKKSLEHHADVEMTVEEYPFLTETFQMGLPTLTDEITFDQIKVDVQLTDAGLMESQQGYLLISGKDQDGKSQTLEIQFYMSFEGINQTTLTPLNLDGKNLEPIKVKKVHDFH